MGLVQHFKDGYNVFIQTLPVQLQIMDICHEAIWIGSRLGGNEKLLPNKKLSWNTSGKFKLQGIRFNLLNEYKEFSSIFYGMENQTK